MYGTGYTSTTKVVQMIILGLTLTFFWAGSDLCFDAFVCKKC